MLKNGRNGYFYIKNVFEWLISRVFGNFTVTFMVTYMNHFFGPKNIKKQKGCSRKKIEIFRALRKTF
jgi:hypothetical protein